MGATSIDMQFDARWRSSRRLPRRLDALSEELRRHSPSVVRTLRSWLPWPTLAAVAAPRGMYLWGGVGRGKTLLMDLFFASLKSPQGSRRIRGRGVRAERTHFYRFMRQVHAELAGIEGRLEPLDVVAQRIARAHASAVSR